MRSLFLASLRQKQAHHSYNWRCLHTPGRCGILLLPVLFLGCASLHANRTLGDQQNAQPYGYTPLDPLTVHLVSADGAQPVDTPITTARLLCALPDITSRIAVGQVSDTAGISWGPVKVGYEGSNYVVVVDYILSQTLAVPISATAVDTGGGHRGVLYSRAVGLDSVKATGRLPAYVGVGLRLTANVRVNKGHVNLSNLPAIAAAAQANQVTGTMTVQTLGIGGSEIVSQVPIPSDVNQTTIQNALVGLGAIKSKLFDPSTALSLRLVGVYNNFGGGQKTIQQVIAQSLRQPLDFPLGKCLPRPKA